MKIKNYFKKLLKKVQSEKNFKLIACIILITSIMQISLCNKVYADDENEEEFSNLEIQDVSTNLSSIVPSINSRRYIIYDRLSKRAIYGKDYEKETAMASTTKIMTAIIVLENSNNLNEKVIINEKASKTGGSTLGLKKDDEITINDLLYGLLLRSGNDAAVALSFAIAENTENFISLMNKKAKELNLKHTNFVTPHGLDDPKHYTTPLELAKITDYALENKEFSKIVKTISYTIYINGVPKTIKNTNEILCSNVDGVYGVKTGFTNNAGRCLVTAVKRNNLDFIIIVLGADSRKYRAEDTIKLINYAFKTFRYENIENSINEEFDNWKNINLNRITMSKAQNKIQAKIENIPIKSLATNKNITFETNAVNYIEAPSNKNQKIGNIIVKSGDEIIENIDILLANDIKRKNLKDYYTMLLKVFS